MTGRLSKMTDVTFKSTIFSADKGHVTIWRWMRNPYFLRGVSIISAIAIWQFVSTHFFEPAFFPPPLQVLRTGLDMIL